MQDRQITHIFADGAVCRDLSGVETAERLSPALRQALRQILREAYAAAGAETGPVQQERGEAFAGKRLYPVTPVAEEMEMV